MYPAVYLAVSLFAIINRVQNASQPDHPVFALYLLHSLTSPTQGLPALIMGVTYLSCHIFLVKSLFSYLSCHIFLVRLCQRLGLWSEWWLLAQLQLLGHATGRRMR
jgi:hypothetical protein